MKQLTRKTTNLLLVMILVPVLSGCGLGFGQALGGLLILAAGGTAAISGGGGNSDSDGGFFVQGEGAPPGEVSPFGEITRSNLSPELISPELSGSGDGGDPQTITNPEPASLFLLGSGMLGAACLKRRRKNR